MLDKAIRDLDRERMGLQNQEKKLVAEIKKAAKQGQMVQGFPPPFRRLLLCSPCRCVLQSHQYSGCLSAERVQSQHGALERCPAGVTGSGKGDGEVAGSKPACSHQDVRPQIPAAGCVLANSGAHPHPLWCKPFREAACHISDTQPCISLMCHGIVLLFCSLSVAVQHPSFVPLMHALGSADF